MKVTIIIEDSPTPDLPDGLYVVEEPATCAVERTTSFVDRILTQDDKEFVLRGFLYKWPSDMIFERPVCP